MGVWILKSIEALVALISVISFSLLVLAQRPPELNDSLYHYQLGNDVWRVFYLRGDLEGFNKEGLNRDAEEVTRLTNLCVYLKEEDVASCLGEESRIHVQKEAWVNGEVTNLTLVLARKYSPP